MKLKKRSENKEKILDILLPLLFLIFLILLWSFYKDPEGISFTGKMTGYMFNFFK